ncbi:Rid family detoxifying hydrolase [Sphingomonas sp. PL-96]|nr:Rid family detoxifying hydrolase [Sphingomonas sp. PL-96]
MVFTSGQIGLDADSGALVEGGFEAQARKAFDNLKAVVAAAGLSFGDVVKCNAFLTDVANFAAFNDIYTSYFEAPHPARTTIGVAQLPLEAQVEVELILQRSGGTR